MSRLLEIFKFGFGALNPQGMFSPTEKVLDIMQQQKGTPEQMFSQMKKIGGKPVKEEMLFTGVEDAFATTPKVTKEELLDYLSDNKTEIDQIVKSDKKMKEAGQGDYQFYRIDFSDIGASDFTEPELYQTLIDKPKILPHTDDLKETISAIEIEELNPDNVKFRGGEFNIRPELVQYRFQEGKDIYDIRGSDDYGYEVYENDKLFVPDGQNSLFPSLNESGLIVNSLREEKFKKANPIQQSKFDLSPRHEAYTLPGGDNYQEIVLSMPNLPDKYTENLGKLTDTKQIMSTSKIIPKDATYSTTETGMRSVKVGDKEIIFDPDRIKALEQGKVVEAYSGVPGKFQMNPETKEIMRIKPEYVNSTHFYEPNVLTWLRTKDRTDIDGNKILYVEEIQSDLSQRGRGRLLMGLSERKNFINKKNPIIYGDILDDFDKLKKITNIDEYKGVRQTIMPNAQDNKITGIGQSFVGHKDAPISSKYLDETGLKNIGYSLDDLIKKQMTKYKNLTLKPKQLQNLVNQGISKNNVAQFKEIVSDANIDKLLKNNTYVYKPEVQADVEKSLIGYENKLYTNVDDYVEPQYIEEQIETLKAGVFFNILRDKLLTMKTNSKDLLRSQNNINTLLKNKPEYKDSIMLNTTWNSSLAELLKGSNKIDIFTPEEINDLVKSYYTKEEFNKLEDDALENFLKIEGITKQQLIDNVDIVPHEFSSDVPKKAQIRFKQFRDMYFNSKLDNIIEEAEKFNYDELERFDYSPNAKQEVFDTLKNLKNNLSKAVSYNTRINPLSETFPSAPFMGSTERFTELAIKNALTYASKNGYDGVAFSSGKIHQKRWNSPELVNYYDKTIPKVLNDLFKQTGVEVEDVDIFLDKNSLDEYNTDRIKNRYDFYNKDVLNELDQESPIGFDSGSEPFMGYIGDQKTIYLKKEGDYNIDGTLKKEDTNAKKYIDSGVSLYTPIVGTGLTGVVTSKLLGSEEDIVEDEVL